MAGPYMNVIPRTFTGIYDIAANTSPHVLHSDALFCEIGGVVTVTTSAEQEVASKTNATAATHNITMAAGMVLNIATEIVVGDGTFKGHGFIL